MGGGGGGCNGAGPGGGFNAAGAQPTRTEAEELQQARFRSQFRKTEMCRYFRSGCRNGAACQYAHGEHELANRPDLTKTSLCRRWAKSSCPLSAEECRFAHGASDLRVTAQYEKSASGKGFAHRHDPGAGDYSGAYGQFGDDMRGLRGDQGMMQPPWPGADMLGGGLWPGQQNFPWGGLPEGGREGQEFQPGMMPLNAMAMPYMQMPGGGGLPGGGSPTSGGYSGPGGMQMPGGMMGFQTQGASQPATQAAPQPASQPAAGAAGAAATVKKQDVQLMVKCAQGGTVKFKIKTTMPLRKLMDAFCSRKTLERSQVRFSVGGAEVQQDDTANKLGLMDDSIIDAEILKDPEQD